MKVAIIHYWLKEMRGGEKVVERLCQLFPGADLYTHVFRPDRVTPRFAQHRVEETFIGRLPFAAGLCESLYLPLTGAALDRLDLTGYDLVISSESAPAKGVITRPDALHVCYCHSPMRYVWDQFPFYRRSSGAIRGFGLGLLAPALRRWDLRSAQLVDRFIANSSHTARRIRKFYRREATVIAPPVDPAPFAPAAGPGEAYLFVGALTPYKRADLAVEAFARLSPSYRLEIIGAGEKLARLRPRAPANVTFRGRLGDAELARAYARARALVFPGEEDFGIVPVEAMAAGRPVVALRAGGALDSVIENETGIFFDEPTPEALALAIERTESRLGSFDPATIRHHAESFAPEYFDAAIEAEIEAGFAELRAPLPRR